MVVVIVMEVGGVTKGGLVVIKMLCGSFMMIICHMEIVSTHGDIHTGHMQTSDIYNTRVHI